MKDEMNYIDELFDKELGAYEMGTASQGWAAVSEGLAKKGFLAFFRTSLLLKLAAAISTAGLISFLTIISINPDFFVEDSRLQNKDVICQPGDSPQSSALSPHLADDAVQPAPSTQHPATSPQSSVLSPQLADDAVHPAPSDQHPATSPQSSALSPHLADDAVHPAPSTQHPATSPQSSTLSPHLADDAVHPAPSTQHPATSPQSSALSPQLADDAVHPAPSDQHPATSPQSSVLSPHLADDAVHPAPSTQHPAPSTQHPAPSTQHPATVNTISNINNEALPIHYTMPQRGFVPTTFQEYQTIALKQEYLSPPVTNRGYNPLSWAVSAYLAPQQPSVLLQSKDLEGEALLTYIESGLQQPSVFNGGVRMEVRGRNFLLESGLSFLQINQKANYQSHDIYNRDTTLWSFQHSTYTEIDTLDSYFQVFGSDTSWYYITETNVINQVDSTSMDSTITTREDLAHTFTNRYKYLEVPLIVGYSFTKGRLTTSVKAGVISSFLWKSYGQSIAGTTKNDIYSFTHDDFPTIRLDLYSALELRYFFGPRYFVFGEAYYRRSFNPFIVRDNISYRFNSYGLKLGAGVYF